jgi:uncharacterized membrane protein YoaK (UPF0700 family)
MKQFNFSLLVIGTIAGLLVGVLTGHPAIWITVGVLAGCFFAMLMHPRKKSCCQ